MHCHKTGPKPLASPISRTAFVSDPYEEFRNRLLSDVSPRPTAGPATADHDVAAAIINARRMAGLSQVDLARRMGTAQSAISRLESGRANASVEMLRRVAEATGQTIVLEIAPEAPRGV